MLLNGNKPFRMMHIVVNVRGIQVVNGGTIAREERFKRCDDASLLLSVLNEMTNIRKKGTHRHQLRNAFLAKSVSTCTYTQARVQRKRQI